MKHTKEEIINALKVIKDECEGTICGKCPFGSHISYNGTLCKLRLDEPVEWEIAELPPPETWRALK